MLNNIPNGLQTYFLPETESEDYPVIRREGKNLFIPIFIRQETRTDETGERTIYRFFEVETEYKGQDTENYDKCVSQSYAAIREFLYGSPAVQEDLKYHHKHTAHVLAVKDAIRKPGQTAAPEGIARWEEIKADFWAIIDRVLASVGQDRSVLPDYFNDKYMFQWAHDNQVPENVIKEAKGDLILVSCNLDANARNWCELFD